jgi:tetratricopeptide (TPR) repeat protein
MPDQWSLPELLASEVAMTNRLAFEKEVSSSPLGRRSLALRERAHELVRNDREEEAFKLYEEAASLHAEDDPSPAAAMCWFDLARTYDRRATGVTTANLRNAESLYRRALGSPALALDVHRMGTVRDGLASCLRALAQEPLAQHQEESLLIEATSLFEAAVTLAISTGPFGAEDVVSFSHNLGNCLVQRGDLDEALLAFDRAEAYARRLDTLVFLDQRVEHLSRILVHAAQARDLRGRDGDRAHADRALREVLVLAHPEWIDMAEMRLAGMLLRDPAVPRDSALAQLRKVRVDRIKSKHLDQLVQLYVDVGQRREALVVLHQQIGGAMKSWRGAMADNAAAHHALEAQRLAHVAARLHIEEEDALEAFCTLEDVSGLRFSEEIAAFSWAPSSAIARVLRDHHQIRSQIAVMLDDFASRMAHGHADLLGELLAASVSARAEVGDGGDAASQLLHDALEEAAQHSDPVGCLQRSAERIGKESSRLREQLSAIDPGYDTRDMPWLFRLTRDVLRNLLLEHPDHALVRISLTSDLFVIAVWLEGDEVVARGRRVATPRGLFRQLEAYGKDVKTAPLEPLTAAFAALDLSAVLPSRRMAHAVLLPSYLASLLPLGALGPTGKTLLDHFDALSWMPCLTPLFARHSPGRRRAGTVSVAPGGTSHHVLALGVPLSDELQIEGEQATVEHVLDVARSADVMCFYTHGQHEGEHGPEISLHGDRLDEQSIQHAWTGMERVELWACQSGVNVPSDPLTPPVDETFGLDNLFVRRGVRSAIGTLWKVPDLVTACMVRTYRNGLESGLPAPRALANAQRWWRDEGAQSLRQHLTRMPIAEGLAAFAATLGELVEAGVSDAEIEALLGPAPAGGASTNSDIEKRLDRLAHPMAWAGFRFVGVAERRPIAPWNEEIQRPLTAEETTRVERILVDAATTKETAGRTFDEWLEVSLTEATKLAPDAHPSPEQAIKVARIYRDRIVSTSRHNLFAALAWLHEALAVLDWTHKGVRRREARQSLSLEAAWLWIDLARGETLLPIELVIVPAPPDRRQLLLPVSDNYFCRSRPDPSAYPTAPACTPLG